MYLSSCSKCEEVWKEHTTTLGTSRVKSNDFMADEVSTRFDTLGDGVADGATGGHDSGRTPGVGGAITAVFLDLEPNGTVQAC